MKNLTGIFNILFSILVQAVCMYRFLAMLVQLGITVTADNCLVCYLAPVLSSSCPCYGTEGSYLGSWPLSWFLLCLQFFFILMLHTTLKFVLNKPLYC